MSDSISNFIVSLQNAAAAGKELVRAPQSKVITAIAGVLEREGYLAATGKKGRKQGRHTEVAVAYDEDGESRVRGVRRISKPGKRVYVGASGIRGVKSGYGDLIISTPKGIMTGAQARREKVGGEALFEIW